MMRTKKPNFARTIATLIPTTLCLLDTRQICLCQSYWMMMTRRWQRGEVHGSNRADMIRFYVDRNDQNKSSFYAMTVRMNFRETLFFLLNVNRQCMRMRTYEQFSVADVENFAEISFVIRVSPAAKQWETHHNCRSHQRKIASTIRHNIYVMGSIFFPQLGLSVIYDHHIMMALLAAPTAPSRNA